ncbi:MAG: YlxR family protein [Anaerolineaceae bacterium]|nr:YlxR family protein [Anaerolineaceae bacterium]
MPKRSLIRIVKGPEGVLVDPTSKAQGRGAYLHDNRSCWVLGLKGSLAHALRTTISEKDLEGLKAFMAGMLESSKEESTSLNERSEDKDKSMV